MDVFERAVTESDFVASIKRERVQDQKVYLDRPYYVWTIDLDKSMTGGAISFGAVGFTQELRAQPLLTQNQNLSLQERRELGAVESSAIAAGPASPPSR